MYSDSHYYTRRSDPAPPVPRGNKRWAIWGIALLVIALAAFFVMHSKAESKRPAPLSILETQNAPLTTKLNAIITAQPAKVGVAVADIKLGYTFTAGSTIPFQAASTGKLFTAAAYYALVENGQATMTQQVGAWPASFQMKEMINISDNDSWHDLQGVVTDPGLAHYVKSHGIVYDVADNTIAPAQMTNFLSKLYAGKLIDSADRQQLFSYMQQTNMEQMIHAVTPASVTVYHKYGLLDGMLADVGIVRHNGQTYAIAIYTQNADDSDDLTRIVTIRKLAAVILRTIYPDVTPLSPPAPTSVDD